MLLDIQRARGTAESWVAVFPVLRTELKPLDAFLIPPGPDGFARFCRVALSQRMEFSNPASAPNAR